MRNPRRRAALGLLVCLALVAAAAVRPERVELFQNNGFEEELDGWRTLDMSKTCRFEIDKKVKKAGKHSLRIERGDGERPDFVKQFVDLPGDAGKLTFSALARVDKPGGIRATLLISDAADKTLASPELGTQGPTRKKWKELSGELDVPEGAKRVGVNFWFAEEGVVWLDDVSLVWVGKMEEERDAPDMTLLNGDFSKGLEGWEPLGLQGTSVKGKHDKGQGKGSLRLERDSKRLFPMGSFESRATRGKRQKRAELSFAVRAEAGALAFVSLHALGPAGGLLSSERFELKPRGKGFEAGKLKMEIPPGTSELAVIASLAGHGQAWFDDFVLEGK